MDLYLSRLTINLRDRAVRRDLADCAALHRTIMSAFPPVEAEPARAAYRVLFRVELSLSGVGPHLLVQSAAAPQWQRLREGYVRVGGVSVRQVADAYVCAARARRRLRFRLQANVTRKIGADGKANGQRVPLRREADQIAWLVRQGAHHGFEVGAGVVRSVLVRPSDIVRGHRPQGTVTVEAVTFDGEFTVTEPDEFLKTLVYGIGPAKAYGCGLVSIAPVRRG